MTHNDNNNATDRWLLGEILSSTKEESVSQTKVDLLTDSFIDEALVTDDMLSQKNTIWNEQEKKKKTPLNTTDFLRIVWAILLVALIFFGAFLAYIVFNPGQASFFTSFGINPGDIARLLKQLVSAIFWVVTFLLSVVWIIFLFRAILTKKEFKKKKTISIIWAVFFGILLFSDITLWASLVTKINATDYENPNGGVLVYDNEKFTSERFNKDAQMYNFDNLIWSLELRFDLRADANVAAKLIDISSYKINFDGATCLPNGSSNVEGINAQDNPIICTFDQTKVFRPTGIYEGIDRVTHEHKTMPINFQPIQIIGTVDIKKTDTSVTYNASALTSFGNIRWLVEQNNNLVSESTNTIFSITKKEKDQVLCLNISTADTCDKLFMISAKWRENIEANILHKQDEENPLKYAFSLGNKRVKSGEIVDYKWIIDNHTVSNDSSFDYVFSGEYKDVKIKVILTDSAGKTTELNESFSILYPLNLVKWSESESLLHILDSSQKSLIDNTYNKAIKAYYITDISTPENIILDATDIKVENPGYELTNVAWDMNGDGMFEKNGMKQMYELVEEKRYTIQVQYTFVNTTKNITTSIKEKIIFEPREKDINIILKLTQDFEYAPTVVHLDGSASIPKTGTITKFMYDFGEGKEAVEGDAIQDYSYRLPGEYIITFTAVRDDGVKASSSRKIILKAIPKNIKINTSVSSGIVWKPIDFDTNGTIGQIDTYHWDFGDWEISNQANPIHAYAKAGKYMIKISVTYTDRTIKSTDKEIIISE